MKPASSAARATSVTYSTVGGRSGVSALIVLPSPYLPVGRNHAYSMESVDMASSLAAPGGAPARAAMARGPFNQTLEVFYLHQPWPLRMSHAVAVRAE